MATIDVDEKFAGSIVKNNGQKTSGVFRLVRNEQDILFFREESSGEDIHIPFQAVSEIIKDGISSVQSDITVENAENLEGYNRNETVPNLLNNDSLINENTTEIDFLKQFNLKKENTDKVSVRPIYGEDFQSKENLSRSTTDSETYQTKLSHQTPSLDGEFLVQWQALIDTGSAEYGVRLYNTTSNNVIGKEQVGQSSSGTDRLSVGAFAILTFNDESKNFEIQWKTSTSGSSVGIQDARLIVYRVQ